MRTGPREIVAPGDAVPKSMVIQEIEQCRSQRQIEVLGQHIVDDHVIEAAQDRTERLSNAGCH